VSQPAADCFAVGFIYSAVSLTPWTLNLTAAKYYAYSLIRLAAGFQKRSAMPASYQMQSHIAILIAYCMGMKKDHQTLLNFAIFAAKWQKSTPSSYEVACKKNFMVGPKGGGAASHRAPL